jgi:hypothetical protein
MDYFYHKQIRRYLTQFIRIFSDVKIETYDNGVSTQSRVPIVYGDPSWQVAQLLKGQSENTMLPSPMFAAWIVGFDISPDRRQDSQYVSKKQALERKFDEETNSYTDQVGNRYSIDRYMPVPYDMTFQLDIWTTSTTTKLQIWEQILSIFNPSLQLQTNQNPFDWSNIFEVELINLTWTNRSIGLQSEIERDIASIQFKVPIWISPPAKLKKISVIERINKNMHSSDILSDSEMDAMLNKGSTIPRFYDPFNGSDNSPDVYSGNYGDPSQDNNPDRHSDGHNHILNDTGNHVDPGSHLSGSVTAPGNFYINIGMDGYRENQIVLLNSNGEYDSDLSWKDLFSLYGEINEETTIIRLYPSGRNYEDEDDIFGYVKTNDANKNILDFTIDEDSLPALMDIGPVDKLIDPTKMVPGNQLPPALVGQQYLLTEDIPSGLAWGGINGKKNDIIQYNGSSWIITFDSRTSSNIENTLDLSTGTRYTYIHGSWEYAFIGKYKPKHWKLDRLYKND